MNDAKTRRRIERRMAAIAECGDRISQLLDVSDGVGGIDSLPEVIRPAWERALTRQGRKLMKLTEQPG